MLIRGIELTEEDMPMIYNYSPIIILPNPLVAS
jgi:hypothetical protein